jgi:hypothetical protein
MHGTSVNLCVACPLHRHPACTHVRAILNETKELVFCYRLPEFTKDVIVYVSRFATGFKERSCVGVPIVCIIPRKKIGTHRKQNGESVRVGTHFCLVGKPIVNSKGDSESLFTIFVVLGECTRLERYIELTKSANKKKQCLPLESIVWETYIAYGISCMYIWLDIRISSSLVAGDHIIQNVFSTSGSPWFAGFCPGVDNRCKCARVGLEVLITVAESLFHDRQDLLGSCC